MNLKNKISGHVKRISENNIKTVWHTIKIKKCSSLFYWNRAHFSLLCYNSKQNYDQMKKKNLFDKLKRNKQKKNDKIKAKIHSKWKGLKSMIKQFQNVGWITQHKKKQIKITSDDKSDKSWILSNCVCLTFFSISFLFYVLASSESTKIKSNRTVNIFKTKNWMKNYKFECFFSARNDFCCCCF